MNFQGDKASEIFHGKGQTNAAKLFYAESGDLFAKTIRDNVSAGEYTLVDLGGHKGEFLSELLTKLPEYKFNSIIVDVIEGVDVGLNVKKVVGDIRNTGFQDKSIDIVILRYVLAWNLFDNQKSVLKEISRICKGICIIQHQGADSDNPIPLQNATAKIFAGAIPILKRDNGFLTESKQVEQWMNELGITYKKIQERRVETLSETFIEKFALTSDESKTITDILEGCDYINQSAYVLDFRK